MCCGIVIANVSCFLEEFLGFGEDLAGLGVHLELAKSCKSKKMEAVVPGEFGSVLVRVKSVRDVFAGKNYAEMCVFAS